MNVMVYLDGWPTYTVTELSARNRGNEREQARLGSTEFILSISHWIRPWGFKGFINK